MSTLFEASLHHLEILRSSAPFPFFLFEMLSNINLTYKTSISDQRLRSSSFGSRTTLRLLYYNLVIIRFSWSHRLPPTQIPLLLVSLIIVTTVSVSAAESRLFHSNRRLNRSHIQVLLDVLILEHIPQNSELSSTTLLDERSSGFASSIFAELGRKKEAGECWWFKTV